MRCSRRAGGPPRGVWGFVMCYTAERQSNGHILRFNLSEKKDGGSPQAITMFGLADGPPTPRFHETGRRLLP